MDLFNPKSWKLFALPIIHHFALNCKIVCKIVNESEEYNVKKLWSVIQTHKIFSTTCLIDHVLAQVGNYANFESVLFHSIQFSNFGISPIYVHTILKLYRISFVIWSIKINLQDKTGYCTNFRSDWLIKSGKKSLICNGNEAMLSQMLIVNTDYFLTNLWL